MDYQREIALVDAVVDQLKANAQSCRSNDEFRSAHTDGTLSGLITAMRLSGHQADYGSWNNNGCLQADYLTVDGMDLLKDGLLQPAALQHYKESLLPATELTVYQVNMDRDSHRVCFLNSQHLEKLQGTAEIDSGIYDRVYTGFLKCKSLEDIYKVLNTNQPEDYRARSLSVSDVIHIGQSDFIQAGYYFCDSFGFTSIEFDPSRTQDGVLLNLENEKVKAEQHSGLTLTEKMEQAKKSAQKNWNTGPRFDRGKELER